MRSSFLGVGIVTAAIVLAGCQATKGGGGGKVATELAPNLADYHLEQVAILAVVNTTGDPEAEEMADFMTRALFATDKYVFASSDNFAQDAGRLGVQDQHARMVSTWRKKRTVDEFVVQKVLGATGYDAVIGMEITKWEEAKIDPTQEGTSDTSVGIRVTMYGADGTLLWSASDLKVEHSASYLPSYNTTSTATGEARTTSASAVPDPPPIRKVAAMVAEEVAATLPLIKRGVETGS